MNDVFRTNLIAELEKVRRRLVETGTRNRLVHVNRAAKRANVLNIVGERSADIYDLLRTQGQSMRFQPRDGGEPDEEAEAGGPLLAVVDEDETDREARYKDLLLETWLDPEALQRRLLRLFTDARTAEEEHGVNILYLALGFLRWYENEKSDILRESPLILLPVELIRDKHRATFNLSARDTEIVTNMPLQKRLQEDFGLELPEIDEDESFSPEAYFNDLATWIEEHPRWSIDRDGMQLGFFSFSKLLMMRDLDPERWPENTFEAHPILGGLLGEGFERPEPLFGPQERLDPRLSPADLLHVVEADASQTRVIEEVRAGRNLVVQGPPGTGKSQTIANIIAAAVHDGKQVLFVAEKMAALTVVHDRLKKVGLRDLCLEIHSRAANKRVFLQELQRTRGGAATPGLPGPPDALTKARDQLNAMSDLLHSPVPGYAFTPFRAMAEIIGFFGRDVPPPNIPRDGFADLGEDERQKCADLVSDYADLLGQTGPRAEHPFAGVGAIVLQPTDLQRLKPDLTQATEMLSALHDLTTRLSRTSERPLPETVSDCAQFHELLSAAADRPTAGRDAAPALLPRVEADRLSEALEAGKEWAEARDAAAADFTEVAFEIEPDEIRIRLAPGVGSFWSRLFGPYRGASRELKSLLTGPLPKSPADRLRLLDTLVTIRRRRKILSEEEGWLSDVLGPHWRGERTAFAAFQEQLAWLYRIVQIAPFEESDAIDRLCDAAPDAAALGPTLEQVNEVLDGLQSRLSISWEGQSLEEVSRRIDAMEDGFERYEEWTRLATLAERLEVSGLGALLSLLDEGKLEPQAAKDEFLYATAEARWDAARAALPALDRLAHLDRDALVTAFRDLESTRLEETRRLVCAKHRAQLPTGSSGQMGFLLGEMAKQRRHKSIRRIMKTAGQMVQRIKPVLLMSPISIAQYLPPGSTKFDLLLIDEASQVRPEDALGAIVRCHQIVVVGDQKQLPPTSFFDRISEPEEETEDEEDEAPIVGATELESILTLCEARGLNPAMLEWHYRSRDPSLITVNNAEFYGRRLILPPSPIQNDPNYGLDFRLVPGVYSSQSLGDGRPRTNRIEAEAVAQEIADHARTRPDLSLGVVAFSKAQSDMLTEVLEYARRGDATLDEFLREGHREDVFVKNIENVQGDERDVILISVGYGPSAPGDRLAKMAFGPINGEGGERRLNVLFSRARTRCLVFCSFDPNDINLARTSKAGPRVLKRFLEFARSGQTDQPEVSGDSADSPFEEDVAKEIRRLGYSCDHQVGAAGFKIDLGVRHPEQPGRYIMAVECDGATYHSALWARERDRLRQDVLEGLGWRFHRIWSTDWFLRRKVGIDQLRSALEAAAIPEAESPFSGANAGTHIPEPVEEPAYALPKTMLPPPPALKAPAYIPSTSRVSMGVEPHLVPTNILADLVTKIVETEGPIHKDLVARRVAEAFRKQRSGRRIKDASNQALRRSKRSGLILIEGAFAMTPAQQEKPPVRDRSGGDAPTRAELLPPIEIRAAAARVVTENGEMRRDELIVATARFLGIARAGQGLRDTIDRALLDEPG